MGVIVSGGGGGPLNFSSYVGSGQASTLHPQKISGISSNPKKYLKFYQPKKVSPFCTMTVRKDPNDSVHSSQQFFIHVGMGFLGLNQC